MKNKRKVEVFNRSGGSYAYKIDSIGVTRYWKRPGDHLNIEIGELIELKTVPGGRKSLKEYLLIKDKEALKIIFEGEELEPEYQYGIEEVDFLLYEGESEQLLDALDYAPKGVLDLIKKNSVQKLPNTTAKIEAINKKFKTDINKAYDLNKDRDVVEEEEIEKPRRRSKPVVVESEKEVKPKERYKVVSREES